MLQFQRIQQNVYFPVKKHIYKRRSKHILQVQCTFQYTETCINFLFSPNNGIFNKPFNYIIKYSGKHYIHAHLFIHKVPIWLPNTSQCYLLKDQWCHGRIQDVFSGGGAQQIMCAHAHHEREARCPLQPYAVLYYLSLILKHYDTKWGEKNILNTDLRGGGGEATYKIQRISSSNAVKRRWVHKTD